MSDRRYEISILIGPCSQHDAELAMAAAHTTAHAVVPDPGTSLNYWDDEAECPGDPVPGVDVFG